MAHCNSLKWIFFLGVFCFFSANSVAKSDSAKAGQFFEKGKYAKAATYYQKALAANPKNAEYHFKLGATFDALEKFDDAILSYEAALKYDYTDKYLIYNNLGVSYGKKKVLHLAITAFEQSLQLNPKYVGALFNLGMAYITKGDKENALRQFEKLKTLDFDSAQRLMENLSGDEPPASQD